MVLNPGLKVADLPAEGWVGLRRVRVERLRAGERLVRFASTAVPSHRWATSPWWFRQADYDLVLAAHAQGGWSLGWLGREAMALRPTWSRTDVVVKAEVLADINVFAGLGRAQHGDPAPNGMRFTFRGWPTVTQLYVPGLISPWAPGVGRQRLPAFAQTLRVLRQKVISSYQIG